MKLRPKRKRSSMKSWAQSCQRKKKPRISLKALKMKKIRLIKRKKRPKKKSRRLEGRVMSKRKPRRRTEIKHATKRHRKPGMKHTSSSKRR